MRPSAREAILILFVFLGILSLGPAPSAEGPSADPLWEKALALAAKTREAGLHPGRMEMRSTVKRPDGTLESESVILFRVFRQGGQSETEVLSATENGKDVTAKLRAEEARAKEREKKGGREKDRQETSVELEPGYHPFAAGVQGRVTYARVGAEGLAGRSAVVFRFRHAGEGKGGSLVGRAWLDAASGEPLQVEVSPDPLPKHVEEMRSTVRFETGPEGFWIPATTDIHGEGGMLWIRRVFDSSVRFLDWHREADEPDRPPAARG